MNGAAQNDSSRDLLTVAIPTYNRNGVLAENLRLLLPQLGERCRLLIIDNCSDTPVADTLAELLQAHCPCEWRIMRNATNIGANANVLRCFELCESKWVWVLGDDDPVWPDAIRKIFAVIEAHPDCIFCNFAGEIYARPQAHSSRGLSEFIAQLDDFSNVLFISTGFYCAEQLRPHLTAGYLHTGSYAPHLALLLSALDEHNLCLFHTDAIVHHDNEAPIRWSYVSSVSGWYDLLDLLKTDDQRRKLAQTFTDALLPVLPIVTKQLVLMGLREGRTDNAVHYYRKISRRVFMYNARLSLRAKLALYGWFIRNPKLFAFFYRRLRSGDFAKEELKALYS